MNNYVVFDGFFPDITQEIDESMKLTARFVTFFFINHYLKKA